MTSGGEPNLGFRIDEARDLLPGTPLVGKYVVRPGVKNRRATAEEQVLWEERELLLAVLEAGVRTCERLSGWGTQELRDALAAFRAAKEKQP